MEQTKLGIINERKHFILTLKEEVWTLSRLDSIN